MLELEVVERAVLIFHDLILDAKVDLRFSWPELVVARERMPTLIAAAESGWEGTHWENDA